MEVYRVEAENLERVPRTKLGAERNLEEHLIKSRGAEIGGVKILYVSRQSSPKAGGTFDLLGVDSHGNTVIVELKRDKAPRNIVSQALEYASGIREETYADLESRYQSFLPEAAGTTDESSLLETHATYFDREDDPLSEREFNTDQRLLLVGTDFSDITLNMADFLREHGIDVVCVEYRTFADSDELQLLTTENVRRPLHEEPQPRSQTDNELSDVKQLQLAFWEAFTETLSEQADTPLTTRSPKAQNYYKQTTNFGNSGVYFVFAVDTRSDRLRCKLVLQNEAQDLYEELNAERELVEDEIGVDLEWEPPTDTRNRGTILLERSGDISNRGQWDDHFTWFIEMGERFHETFDHRVRD